MARALWLTVPAGRVLAREVTTSTFFQGYPAARDDNSREALVSRLTWEDGLLRRVLVTPDLPAAEPVGHDFSAAVLTAYWRAIGWVDGPVQAEWITWNDPGVRRVALPPDPWRGTVVAMARAFMVLPHHVLALPISDFLLSATLYGEAVEREVNAHERAMQEARMRRGG